MIEMEKKKDGGFKLVANNKKAYFDYFIEDKWEAGMELYGTEVKSVRMGKASIKAVSYTHLTLPTNSRV